MKKKTLFSILLASILILPLSVLAADADAAKIVGNIETAFKTIGTSVVVIGWIVAGILYLTAAGSPEKLGTAKKALIAAIIGTAIIAVAHLGFDSIKKLLKIE